MLDEVARINETHCLLDLSVRVSENRDTDLNITSFCSKKGAKN